PLFLVTLLAVVTPTLQAQDKRILPKNESGRRQALVMGNIAYPFQSLRNAVNDAREMAKALSELGFSVDKLENGTLKDMQRSGREFVSKVRPGDVVLVYYSGHGIQYHGENFLIPIDFTPTTELAIPEDAY